jgi:hypothetical protein
MRRRTRAAWIATALACWSGSAFGQAGTGASSGQDVATAQALFDDGKRLMQAGSFEEGCPKLVESQRLDPGGGTLLAIALCHEGQGRTATAWADFNVALGQARKDGRSDREATALEHIKALEPKLARVRVTVLQRTSGLEIVRDGASVGDAQWGTAIPVDPGEHLFSARAPGKQPWSATVMVQGAGQVVDVRVPPLADAPAARAAPSPAAAPVPAPADGAPKSTAATSPTTSASSTDDGNAQRTWGIVAGGVGVVATTLGAVFGLSASSKWSNAENACPGGRCRSPQDAELGEDAGTAADVSTIAFTVGAIGLVSGAVLYFTAPKSAERTSTALRGGIWSGRF